MLPKHRAQRGLLTRVARHPQAPATCWKRAGSRVTRQGQAERRAPVSSWPAPRSPRTRQRPQNHPPRGSGHVRSLWTPGLHPTAHRPQGAQQSPVRPNSKSSAKCSQAEHLWCVTRTVLNCLGVTVATADLGERGLELEGYFQCAQR